MLRVPDQYSQIELESVQFVQVGLTWTEGGQSWGSAGGQHGVVIQGQKVKKNGTGRGLRRCDCSCRKRENQVKMRVAIVVIRSRLN